jgi:hypothetical protein
MSHFYGFILTQIYSLLKPYKYPAQGIYIFSIQNTFDE